MVRRLVRGREGNASQRIQIDRFVFFEVCPSTILKWQAQADFNLVPGAVARTRESPQRQEFGPRVPVPRVARTPNGWAGRRGVRVE